MRRASCQLANRAWQAGSLPYEIGPGATVSPNLFQALVEHSPEAMLLLDADGVIRYANPPTAPVSGSPSEEAQGQRLVQWILPGDAPALPPLFAACLERPGQLVLVPGFYRHKG